MDKETVLQITDMLKKKISERKGWHYQSLADADEYDIEYDNRYYFQFDVLQDLLMDIELIRFENKQVIGE